VEKAWQIDPLTKNWNDGMLEYGVKPHQSGIVEDWNNG
jgi:hypothetical protein